MSEQSPPARGWDVAERAAFLAGVRLFSGLNAAVLRAVAERMRVRRLRRGAFVFLEGDPATNLSVLAAGRVKVVRETEDAREVILRFIEPGELFGAAGGVGEATYPASAIATEDAVALQLSAQDFPDLVDRQPAFAMAVIVELGSRLREAEARIRDLQGERVERRIARTLLRLARKTGVKTDRGIELGIPLSRQDLAELAGTTLSTASRTLSAWDQQGLVDAGRERVTLLKPHQLMELAEDLSADLDSER
jgi:CRP-like cAMP-binding protein